MSSVESMPAVAESSFNGDATGTSSSTEKYTDVEAADRSCFVSNRDASRGALQNWPIMARHPWWRPMSVNGPSEGHHEDVLDRLATWGALSSKAPARSVLNGPGRATSLSHISSQLGESAPGTPEPLRIGLRIQPVLQGEADGASTRYKLVNGKLTGVVDPLISQNKTDCREVRRLLDTVSSNVIPAVRAAWSQCPAWTTEAGSVDHADVGRGWAQTADIGRLLSALQSTAQRYTAQTFPGTPMEFSLTVDAPSILADTRRPSPATSNHDAAETSSATASDNVSRARGSVPPRIVEVSVEALHQGLESSDANVRQQAELLLSHMRRRGLGVQPSMTSGAPQYVSSRARLSSIRARLGREAETEVMTRG